MKDKKLLIFSAIIIFLAVVFFIFREDVSVLKDNGYPDSPEDSSQESEELKAAYQESVKEIFKEYDYLLGQEQVVSSDLIQLKYDLLSLVVPGDFRDLHFELFFSLRRMEDYLKEGGEEAKNESIKIFNGIKTDYPWLSE